MKPVATHIFADIPEQLPEELFECILKQDNVVIERIVSKGHVTPTGQWYDQNRDEWVLLLQGQATLLFEKNRQFISLNSMRPTQPSSLKIQNQTSLGFLMRMKDGGIKQMDYAY